MANGTLLVTPTLFDSLDFARTAPSSWRKKAYEDLVKKIRRERGTFPDWVLKGSKFEDAVYAKIQGSFFDDSPIDTESKAFAHVCEQCAGGQFQTTHKRVLNVDGLDYLIYGKLDVEMPTEIIDIKTTLNYKGPQKYLSKWQHKMYCWLTGVTQFKYLVVEWVDEPSYKIAAVHQAKYVAPSMEQLEQDIVSGIRYAAEYLQEKNLWDDYYRTFSNNG